MENEFDLSNELQLFKESADKGYKLANKASISLDNSLKEAQNKIRETIDKLKQHPCTIFDVNQSLIGQLKEIVILKLKEIIRKDILVHIMKTN